jgi:hypothetical protein
MDSNNKEERFALAVSTTLTSHTTISPLSQSASVAVGEIKYPVTPTKLRDNRNSESYMGSPFSTPRSNADSLQSAENNGRSVEDQLLYVTSISAKRKKETKRLQWEAKRLRHQNVALNEKLTTHINQLNIDKSCSNKQHKFAISQIIALYAESQNITPGSLPMESLEAMLATIHFEVGMTKDLRTQLRNLEVQTQALRDELMDSQARCRLLENQERIQDARHRDSLQNLRAYQNEAQGLRAKIQALQKEMLAQVSKIEVMSDEVFSRNFRALASMVKSLSRSIQPPQDFDVVDILEPYGLLRDVQKHHWNTRARKKAYVEAWVWSVLICTVFKHTFGFCEDSRDLHDNWLFLFGNDHFSNWPDPTSESENWRLTTVKTLVGQIERGTIIAGQDHIDYAEADELQKEVLKTREHVTNFIKSNLMKIAPTLDLSHISDIIDRAFELALDMSMQPFRVQITWPDTGEDFLASHMSPIPDRNGQDVHEGVVAFIVNPGLTRWGNAHGKQFEV